MCAEYNKGEGPIAVGEVGKTGLFPGMEEGAVQRPGADPAGVASHHRLGQRQRESDEENLTEECSSTESQHQDVREGTHAHTHTHTRLLTHPRSHTLSHSVTQSLTHSLIHSLFHSFTQSLTHSLIHSFIDRKSVV